MDRTGMARLKGWRSMASDKHLDPSELLFFRN